MNLRRFIILFIALTVIAGAAFQLIAVLNGAVLIPKFWVVFGFISGLTLVAYLVSFLGMKNGGETSVYAILGSVVVKLLFCMAFVLVYLLKFRVNSLNFSLQFFSLYFLFTTFEVYCLLRNLRHQIKT